MNIESSKLYNADTTINSHRTAVVVPFAEGFREGPLSIARAQLIITAGDALNNYIKPWRDYLASDDHARYRRKATRLWRAQQAVGITGFLGLGFVISVLGHVPPPITLFLLFGYVALVGLGLWLLHRAQFQNRKQHQRVTAELISGHFFVPLHKAFTDDDLSFVQRTAERITPTVRDGMLRAVSGTNNNTKLAMAALRVLINEQTADDKAADTQRRQERAQQSTEDVNSILGRPAHSEIRPPTSKGQHP